MDYLSAHSSTFVCPSSPNPARLDGDPDSSTWTPVVAISDYGATIGVDPALSSSLNWSGGTLAASGGTASGALYRVVLASFPRFADIKDGLSNTILYAESAGRPYIYQNGVDVSYVNSVDNSATTHVNGGGWARPASEIILRGSDQTGTVPYGNSATGVFAVNVTNGFQSDYYQGNSGDTGKGPTGVALHASHRGDLCVPSRRGKHRLCRWIGSPASRWHEHLRRCRPDHPRRQRQCQHGDALSTVATVRSGV